MKKQTAIDWLIKEFNLESFESAVAFAKQKEKEQVIIAWMDGEGYSDEYSQKEAEHYYNLVYGGEQ